MAPNYPSLWLSLLALCGGLVFLVAGGEVLVSGASRLAKRLGMSPLLVGLTVVAFGTSMPEMFVSLAATLQDHADIMIGNVIGSNIANVGLILGFSAILMPLPVVFSTVRSELYLLLAASLLVAGITWLGTFYRIFGVVFVAALVAYTFLAYRAAHSRKKENGSNGNGAGEGNMPLIGLKIVAGIILLAAGSDFFIDGAVDVARHYGISELIIGLTLAAVGTSLPELASSIAAIRHNESQLLVGNVVGSNLFNLLMVMGATAVITPFALPASLLLRDLPIMIALSAAIWPLLAIGHEIRRLHGVLLLGAYGAYLFFLIEKI